MEIELRVPEELMPICNDVSKVLVIFEDANGIYHARPMGYFKHNLEQMKNVLDGIDDEMKKAIFISRIGYRYVGYEEGDVCFSNRDANGYHAGIIKTSKGELKYYVNPVKDNNGKDYYIFGSNEEELRLSAESLINPKRVESLESINMLDENGKVKMPILS